MKKELLLIGALLLPVASATADVKINVNYSSEREYDDDDDDYEESYYEDDNVEAWFEEAGRRGPYDERIEWEWVVTSSGDRALRFRKASFHINYRSWSYSPWTVKVSLCSPGCHRHHKHYRERDYRDHCRAHHHEYRRHPKKVTVIRYYNRDHRRDCNYGERRIERNNHDRHDHRGASQPSISRPPVRNIEPQGSLKKTHRYLEDAPSAQQQSDTPVKISSGRVRVW